MMKESYVFSWTPCKFFQWTIFFSKLPLMPFGRTSSVRSVRIMSMINRFFCEGFAKIPLMWRLSVLIVVRNLRSMPNSIRWWCLGTSAPKAKNSWITFFMQKSDCRKRTYRKWKIHWKLLCPFRILSTPKKNKTCFVYFRSYFDFLSCVVFCFCSACFCCLILLINMVIPI